MMGAPSAEAREPKRTAVAATYLVMGLLCLGKLIFYSEWVGPGIMPDEIAHISYVAYLAESGEVLPDFRRMPLLDHDGSWLGQRNYLVHPPLFYHLVRPALPGDWHRLSREDLIRRGRAATRWIGAAAVVLMLWIGWRLPLPPTAHLVYAASVASVPMLCFVAGAVNNDVLAWLAGAMTVLGLCRLCEGRPVRTTAALTGGGMGLAILAKLTAGLLCAVAIAICFVWTLTSPDRRQRSVLGVLVVVILLSLPGLAYHAVTYLEFGTLVPPGEGFGTDDRAIAPDVENTRADGPTRLSPIRWTGRFVHLLGVSWVNVVGHRFIDRDSPMQIAGLLLLPVLAALGIVIRPGRGDAALHPTLPALRAAAAACAIVMLIHLVFTYSNHLDTGYLGGVQARYYFPLLPAGLLLAIRPVARWSGKAAATAGALVLVALLLYSDLSAMVEIATDPVWHVPL